MSLPNGRDVAGLTTADGRNLREGVLLRSALPRDPAHAAALHRLLVQTHDRSGRHVAWLARRGYLSLTVQTPEARISVHRHRTHGRRKHLEFKGFLPSPARRELLAAGTYTLAIQAPAMTSCGSCW